MSESDDSATLHLWRRRLSERAFVATNLPLAGVTAAFAVDSLIVQQGRYVGVGAMLAMLAFPWQLLVFLLRGVMWMQSGAIAGRAASPVRRAQITATGARGWVIGGAVSGVWIAVMLVLSRLTGISAGIGAAGFLPLGPVVSFACSTAMMHAAADQPGPEANGAQPPA